MNTAMRWSMITAAALVGAGIALGPVTPAQAAQSNVVVKGQSGTVKTTCEARSAHPALGSVYRAHVTLDYQQHGSYLSFSVKDHRLDVPDTARGRTGARIEMSGPGSAMQRGSLTQSGLSHIPPGIFIGPPGYRDPVPGPYTSTNAWTSGTSNNATTTLSLKVVFDKKNSVAPMVV